MKDNTISVLMTSFNAEKYIIGSIKSLIKQTYKNWKLILIDDGSIDNTTKIVRSLKNKKIKIFELKKNIGRTKALNYGLKKCKTKFTAILDADDICLPKRFEKQLSFLIKFKKFKAVGSWAFRINNSGKKIGEIKINQDTKTFNYIFPLENLISHSTLMFNTSYVKGIGGYPSNLKYAQDYGLMLKIFKNKKLSVVPEFLSKIRVSKNSMTFGKKYKKIAILDRINLLFFTKKNFNLNFFQKLKYYYLLLSNFLKIII